MLRYRPQWPVTTADGAAGCTGSTLEMRVQRYDIPSETAPLKPERAVTGKHAGGKVLLADTDYLSSAAPMQPRAIDDAGVQEGG